LLEIAVRNFSEPLAPHYNFSVGLFSWIRTPMDTMVSQFKEIPRQSCEEEAGGGGVPT